jgi:hypothetical protein
MRYLRDYERNELITNSATKTTIVPKISNCDIYEDSPGEFEKILTNYHKDGNKDAFILGLQESLKILLEINTAFILINLHDSV